MTSETDGAVPVALCFDKGFGAYAAATIASLLANADAVYRVYCLFSGSEEEFPQEILALARRYRCEIVRVPVPTDSFSDWRVDPGKHFAPANYFRLLIPDLVAEDRIIYLDCDLIVTCGLSALYALDLGGAWFAGCVDPKGRATSQMVLPDEDPYLNSGVLLIDLKALREHRPMAVIYDYYKRHEAGVTHVDQCLINKFAEGRKLVLPDQWNLQFNNIEARDVDAVTDAFEGKAIFHFSGPNKPWMEWTSSRLVRLWSQYARLAGLDAPALIRKAGTVGELAALAARQEAEDDWRPAAATWKAIALSLESHLRAAGARG
jgi:lipopolysaccharide biosynthesis glycosyltransferase